MDKKIKQKSITQIAKENGINAMIIYQRVWRGMTVDEAVIHAKEHFGESFGPKKCKKKCLKCGVLFVSQGAHNRLCSQCNQANAKSSALMRESYV